MQEKSSLMDLFSRRPSQPLTPSKPVKKVKSNHPGDEEDDPLHKILSWRDCYKEPLIPPVGTFKYLEVDSIVSDDQNEWGANFQGILIDVDWNEILFEEFRKLQLRDKLINNGIVFIWGANNNIGPLFDYFASQGFQYVQNFMFVMLDRQKIPQKKNTVFGKNTLFNYFKKTAAKEENEEKGQSDNKQQRGIITEDYLTGRVAAVQEIFMEKPSTYFNQTQKVLYMFRKHNKVQPLQLRHQRTSDAFFTIGDNFELDWKSMENVYKMIETLLIKANYDKNKPLQLLQLWANRQHKRKGWVTITQNKHKDT